MKTKGTDCCCQHDPLESLKCAPAEMTTTCPNCGHNNPRNPALEEVGGERMMRLCDKCLRAYPYSTLTGLVEAEEGARGRPMTPRECVEAEERPAAALDVQVGGGHYKDMAIQPVEFIHANGIGFLEGSAIKYLSRWRKKNGIEDLKKARHFIDMLIQMEEENSNA